MDDDGLPELTLSTDQRVRMDHAAGAKSRAFFNQGSRMNLHEILLRRVIIRAPKRLVPPASAA
jgi:hypothetical protein